MNEEFLQATGLTIELLIGFAVSVGIGFLIGLERQFSKEATHKEEQFAGIRTFTLVAIFGFISAFLTLHFGAWFYAVALAGLIAFVIVSYIRVSSGPGNKGGTSEIAVIITFLLGALVFIKLILFALVIMVTLLLLLTFKPDIHLFVKKLNREELLAIILFVVISALVIPFLPNENFGPYDLWNLKEIWKMVVLVSGMSLLGYMISKLMGHKGSVLAGIIGGLVSSTSVALTFSRRSKEKTSLTTAVFLAIGIIGACTIMFPRILFEVYVVNPALAAKLWPPILVIMAAGAIAAFIIYKRRNSSTASEELTLKNPLEFSTAIKFAIFFAAIQWLVKFCTENFGNTGTYFAGAVSGFTDVDAITLSMAKMAKESGNSLIAIRTILLAALSNTLVKFMIVFVVGGKELRRIAFYGFLAIFISGITWFCFTLL
jgi:uncharacterized membrane protein (DUF4010 family)